MQDRNRWVLALAAVLVLSLCRPQMVVAQGSLQGNSISGMFGNRTLGQPLVPGRGTFGGGIQTNPTGGFLYIGRPDGSTAFATPWRRIDPAMREQVLGASPAAQPALQAPLEPQSPQPGNGNRPELPTAPQVTPPAVPEAGAPEGTGQAQQTPGVTYGLASPHASAAGGQAYTRSPEFSDRLTRIARSRGVLIGQGIDVYLSNNVAPLRGTVPHARRPRPAGQRHGPGAGGAADRQPPDGAALTAGAEHRAGAGPPPKAAGRASRHRRRALCALRRSTCCPGSGKAAGKCTAICVPCPGALVMSASPCRTRARCRIPLSP